MINSPAPLAPELAMKEDLHGKEREKKLKNDKVKIQENSPFAVFLVHNLTTITSMLPITWIILQIFSDILF